MDNEDDKLPEWMIQAATQLQRAPDESLEAFRERAKAQLLEQVTPEATNHKDGDA